MSKTASDTGFVEREGVRTIRHYAKQAQAGHAFIALLFCLFILALLGTIIAGTSIYRSLVSQNETVTSTRSSLSLIANYVRAIDATDAVATLDGPEGKALVLVERADSGTYETRVYQYQGNIVEEYALSGSPFTPSKATTLAASETFELSYWNGLLTITCDQGTTCVALRSSQGGA